MKYLVKFALEFDLKFEISDGKDLVKFRGRTFYQRAAKGGTQKGVGHFFLFRSPFGNLFVTFFDVFGHFFAYPLLPPPFCGRVILSARKFRGEFRRVSETSFQISQLFFGNFVQQKGYANRMII